MQFTRIAEHSVDIPELPDDLEAFPVYRVRTTSAGEKRGSDLLRLELRSARPDAEANGPLRFESVEPRTRNWLAGKKSGRAKTISARLGDAALDSLYRWCAQGILVLSVEPPSGPGAPHGNLINWRLADSVLEAVRESRDEAADRLTNLYEEARALAERVQALPGGIALARVLTESKEPDYLRHAIAAVTPTLVGVTRGDRPGSGVEQSRWLPVHRLARGVPQDYQLSPERITGGQAYVYPAHHKGTQIQVAYKRLKVRAPDAIARMSREIEAGTLFGAHPHVMPVLDEDPEHAWFVMPLASASARTHVAELRAPEALTMLLAAVCDALELPHQAGWIHRDLKPDNILLLDGRWVVADWGLARRPRGATSDPGRTRIGTGYGTEGFAAPELAVDAHRAGPPADVYSLGQIIGSILTGRQPQSNIPLIPPTGPWRRIVSRATRLDPAERHQSVTEFADDLNTLRAESEGNH